LFFVRKGLVLLTLQIDPDHARRLYTIGRGALFGELAFLDRGTHSTNVIALTDVDVFVLSRVSLDAFAEQHKKAALNLFEGVASVLTHRIRYLTAELVSLES
jgi:CRP-like cAMP-binding protein